MCNIIAAIDVAQAMFVTKRALQRRLDRKGKNYREITGKLHSELAARHFFEVDISVESIDVLMGYYDAVAFRKVFYL